METKKRRGIFLKAFERLCFVVVILFAFVGSMIVGTALHEYSHVADFEDVARDGEVCALVLPEDPANFIDIDRALGYYEFSYDAENEVEIARISKSTEYKAYALTIVPIFLFFVSIFFVILVRN